MSSALPNKALERPRRVGVPASRAVVRVPPCRSTPCYACGRALTVLLLMTATFFVEGRAASAQQGFAQALPREPRKPPSKNPRAIETWLVATTGVQTKEAIANLQVLLTDPEKDVRLAAAWALAHVRLKETGEDAVAYDEAPRLLRQTRPIFPYEVRQRGIQGIVMVEFIIDERGRVAYAEVRESIPGLDEAAVACVKEWSFAPAKKAGKPVASGARAPMTFRITK
jgi:TonB family protein